MCLGIDPAAERGFNWCCELGRAGPLAVPGLLVACQPVTVAQFKRFVFEEQVGRDALRWGLECSSVVELGSNWGPPGLPGRWQYHERMGT